MRFMHTRLPDFIKKLIDAGKNNNKDRAPGRRKAPGAHQASTAHGLRLLFPARQRKGQSAKNHFCAENIDCPHKPGLPER